MVNGPETATVVGTSGEEILTDSYGRVRIQFHWIARASPTRAAPAGCAWPDVGRVGWGSIYIPRIGQEVIVQFLGGDPDRPVITGSLYNAGNMPPYACPQRHAERHQEPQHKGGAPSNFNENPLRGQEGERGGLHQGREEQTNLVKADASLQRRARSKQSVGNNETVSVASTAPKRWAPTKW